MVAKLTAKEVFSQGSEEDLLKYYDECFDILKGVIDKLYSIPGCGAGGPCHIVTDDDNVRVCDLRYVISSLVMDEQLESYGGVEALMICATLLYLPYRKRVAFMYYYNGMTDLKDIVEYTERQIEEELDE